MYAFGGLFDHFGHHVATEIDFDHNVVGVEVVVAAHHSLAPLRRAAARGGAKGGWRLLQAVTYASAGLKWNFGHWRRRRMGGPLAR
jgi:hypothetical protein